MVIREITGKEKDAFDQVVTHPLQSWAWGEFRLKTGVLVERVGIFDGNKLKQGCQLTIHPIPKTAYTVGYFPKGILPDEAQLEVLQTLGKRHNCILVKLEPNVAACVVPERQDAHGTIRKWLLDHGCKDGRSLFTKYTFQVDLSKSEEELLAGMKSKTRYNIGVAGRNGVVVTEDNRVETFEIYLQLMQETTQRQGFYAHTLDYHRKMWKEMHKAGIARLLTASWKNEILVTWVVFVFNDVMYYPYGASSSEHRDVMASNLMMWEAMRYGKKLGCKVFDLWGAAQTPEDEKDPWHGFTRFKLSFGGLHVKLAPTHDLITNTILYSIFNLTNNLRWKILKLIK